MIYEIINPSDKAYIESNDLKTAQVAILLLGRGAYGLTDKMNKTVLPLFILQDPTDWVKENFGGWDEFNKYIDVHKKEIGECLLTCRLDGKRSSMNKIVGTARRIGKAFCAEK